MNDRLTGIVISVTDLKENDAIVTVNTLEHGNVSLAVKGYKKITSKNVFATQLFDLSNYELDYQPFKQVQILKSASLINEYSGIKADYNKIVIASGICEVVKITDEENIYPFLKETLELLEKSNQPILVFNLFLVEIMKRNGIAPFVDGCVICQDNKSIEAISVSEGGFICNNCNKELLEERRAPQYLKKFRFVNKADYSVYDKLLGLELDDLNITEVLLEFLITLSGISLKSYRSIINLNN